MKETSGIYSGMIWQIGSTQDSWGGRCPLLPRPRPGLGRPTVQPFHSFPGGQSKARAPLTWWDARREARRLLPQSGRRTKGVQHCGRLRRGGRERRERVLRVSAQSVSMWVRWTMFWLLKHWKWCPRLIQHDGEVEWRVRGSRNERLVNIGQNGVTSYNDVRRCLLLSCVYICE